ncbi:c-type cytochrome [Psychromonas hadalis]|uniref:c-type cytochrome n=1 Tax=Psychromonas hadalis TaxID=211669 RepID=UPI0003B6315F|nr:c-type cytochrome [Psychromonas hadalis]
MHLIKRITLLIGLTATLFTAAAFAQAEGDLAARIAPVGDVYLDGEIVTANTVVESSEPAGPRSGEKIYNTYCVACHGTGAAGAPIKGKADQWTTRLTQGEATLIKHAIEGFNAMPARGTCSDCSDDEMMATVQFLIKGL